VLPKLAEELEEVVPSWGWSAEARRWRPENRWLRLKTRSKLRRSELPGVVKGAPVVTMWLLSLCS